MCRNFSFAVALVLAQLASPSAVRADFIYGGLATGALATVEVTYQIGSTGPLPSDGGVREVDLLSSNFNSFLSTGPISGITRGSNGLATADITVNDLILTYGGNTITAQMIGGHATADGHTGGVPEVGGFSDFLGLMVNGQPVAVTGVPNQDILLPDNMKLVLNEQAVEDSFSTITLNALHLYGNPVVDFRIASAHASILTNDSPGTLALLAVALVCLPGLWLLRWIK
jgi:hypothetical protein